jgi:hypothetical protein
LQINTFCQLGQFLICLLFFIQRFLEQGDGFLIAQKVGVCANAPVCGDFLMLYSLRCRNQARTSRVIFEFVFFDDLLTFLDWSCHAYTLLAGRFFLKSVENLLSRWT